ncbi:hypothetical protein GEMRC1_008799 [Eukaryota sp. GEM-RC1]
MLKTNPSSRAQFQDKPNRHPEVFTAFWQVKSAWPYGVLASHVDSQLVSARAKQLAQISSPDSHQQPSGVVNQLVPHHGSVTRMSCPKGILKSLCRDQLLSSIRPSVGGVQPPETSRRIYQLSWWTCCLLAVSGYPFPSVFALE